MQISVKKMPSGNPLKSSPKRSQTLPKPFDLAWKDELNDYVTAMTWSPDGDYLAASSARGEVILWQPGGQRLLLLESPEHAMGYSIDCLGFSANGEYLAAAGQQGQVFVWQMQFLEQPAVILGNPPCWVDCLAWHPTEPVLVFGAGHHFKVWNVATMQLLTTQNFEASSVLALAWHPEGKQLAVSGHRGVKIWQCDNWTAVPELIEVPGASLSVDWSPDGAYLASGNLDRTLTVVHSGTPLPWLMQGFPGKVRQIDWAPATPGQQAVEPMTEKAPVVAAACMEGITVWQQQGTVWENRVLQQHGGTVKAIAFHPTHRLLASAGEDGRLCLWNQAKTLQQTLRGVGRGFSALAWHPQGIYLAAGGDQGDVMIWSPSNRGQGFQRR